MQRWIVHARTRTHTHTAQLIAKSPFKELHPSAASVQARLQLDYCWVAQHSGTTDSGTKSHWSFHKLANRWLVSSWAVSYSASTVHPVTSSQHLWSWSAFGAKLKAHLVVATLGIERSTVWEKSNLCWRQHDGFQGLGWKDDPEPVSLVTVFGLQWAGSALWLIIRSQTKSILVQLRSAGLTFLSREMSWNTPIHTCTRCTLLVVCLGDFFALSFSSF